ncbi:MAG: hypothetical protein IKH49_02055 [Bacteroidales bacterium]|nr:hypothetical protein [Bacteroidales bacterium]
MKKVLFALSLTLITAISFAQNFPAGMRNEITSIEQDDEQYTLFSYKDEDGTFGYYLGLGHVIPLLEITKDDVAFASLSHQDETCIFLGSTVEEVYASLDGFLELLENAPGTTKEFPCRLSSGAERLGGSGTAACMVVKRFLQGKRLSFLFKSGNRTAQADLTKSGIKSLRWSMDIEQKLRPQK